MKTLISLILDRSGSMAGKENDVIGGVNSFLEDQKRVEGEAMVQIATFSNQVRCTRFRQPLRDILPLTRVDYVIGGDTALLDAIGDEIAVADRAWGIDYPDKAIVVIVTDGEENASRRFNKSQIQQMIQQREASGKWSFIYLGASPSAFHEARSLGINWLNTAQYKDTGLGTHTAYMAASASLAGLRGGALYGNLGGILAEDEIKIS